MKKILFIALAFVLAFSFSFCKHDAAKHNNQSTTTEQPKTEATAAVYDCPMHCEGAKSDKPGKCPKCNMDLEKQTK